LRAEIQNQNFVVMNIHRFYTLERLQVAGFLGWFYRPRL
jgi:hypothetical protein